MKFDYSKNETPDSYKCSKCKCAGVSLWITDGHKPKLFCVNCRGVFSNYIAVPKNENHEFWEKDLIPKVGIKWWTNLPTFPAKFPRVAKYWSTLTVAEKIVIQTLGDLSFNRFDEKGNYQPAKYFLKKAEAAINSHGCHGRAFSYFFEGILTRKPNSKPKDIIERLLIEIH